MLVQVTHRRRRIAGSQRSACLCAVVRDDARQLRTFVVDRKLRFPHERYTARLRSRATCSFADVCIRGFMTEIGGNIVKAVVSAARKITGREPAPEASAKKTPARKTAAQKMTAKKAPAKKVAPHKTTAKKAGGRRRRRRRRRRRPPRSQPDHLPRRNQAPQRSAPGPAPSACRCPTAAASAPKSGRPGTTPTARTDRKASPKYYARDEIGKHTGHTKRGASASVVGRS